MTFEPTGDTCTIRLVGVAYAFGMVGHVQRSVKEMAKRMLKELQKVSEVSNNETTSAATARSAVDGRCKVYQR